MAIKTMTWSNRETSVTKAVNYTARVTTADNSDIYLVPDGDIASIGGSVTLNDVSIDTGLGGTFAQENTGAVAEKEKWAISFSRDGDEVVLNDGSISLVLNDVEYITDVVVGDTIADVKGKIEAQNPDLVLLWDVLLVDIGTNSIDFTAVDVGVQAGAFTYSEVSTDTGAGAVQLSYSPLDAITASTGVFTAWDTSKAINPAITAWRVVATGGTVSADMSVKTLV